MRHMKNKKILIIDEDRKFLDKIREVLGLSGYSPIVINDARFALDRVAQTIPDVILLELRMSYKNGFELASEINYAFETRRIPIIAMSSFLKNESEFFLNLCGINSYLKKPFNPLDIIWAIENMPEKTEQWDKELYLENTTRRVL